MLQRSIAVRRAANQRLGRDAHAELGRDGTDLDPVRVVRAALEQVIVEIQDVVGLLRHPEANEAVRPGAVVGYRAVDLTALLTADPVEAVRFAEAELGELIEASDVG